MVPLIWLQSSDPRGARAVDGRILSAGDVWAATVADDFLESVSDVAADDM